MAAKDTVKAVQVDGQVILKIVQHCNEAHPQVVTGQLLGLDVGHTLEVTDCFAFPSAGGDDGEDEAGASYQLDMMRCLREVNVDNNSVGWYQSAAMGAFQNQELVETFIGFHDTIKKCVCIVFDPAASTRGNLVLKAIRLKDSFIELAKTQKLTPKDLREANIAWKDVFVELPIKVHNSSLVQAVVADLAPSNSATQADYERLNLTLAPYLEKNITTLIECVDDLVQEQNKVTMYHKNVARQAQQMAAWLQKRKQENIARRAAGEEALPEEDPTLWKPVPEPSQLDSFLVSNQLASHCDQLNVAATQAIQRMYIMQGIQDSGL